MRELSFLIPIRVDSKDRLENCNTALRFLTRNFPESQIQLIEQDVETKTGPLRKAFPNVVWHFHRTDKHFSRSRALNTGFLNSTRRCVCAYDTDVLLEPDSIRRGVRLILADDWKVVIPFNLIFVELSGRTRAAVIQSLNFQKFSNIRQLTSIPKYPDISARVLSGAVMICDRDMAIRAGGYNSRMVSYGWEDIEFLKRLAKLGFYSVVLRENSLVHLQHERGPDSKINEFYDRNKEEFLRVLEMSEEALREYAETTLRLPGAVGLEGEGPPVQRWPGGLRLWNDRVRHWVNALLVRVQIHGGRGSLRILQQGVRRLAQL